MARLRFGIVFLFAFLFLAPRLDAQSIQSSSFPTVELWGGVSFVSPRADSTFTTTYSPQLLHFTATGRAGETVQFGADGTAGFEAGVNVFPVPHAGLQLLVSFDRPDLSGSTGTYTAELDYTSRQPPDYVERPHHYVGISKGGPMTGRLSQTTVSLNGVGRWALGRQARWEVSGGLSYFRASGEGNPLTYTVFGLGGHSVLFSDVYRLLYSLDATSGFGVNAGTSIDLRLANHVALMGDVRFFAAPSLEMPITVTGLREDSEAYLSNESPATIQERLAPGTVEVTPARWRVLVALKITR